MGVGVGIGVGVGLNPGLAVGEAVGPDVGVGEAVAAPEGVAVGVPEGSVAGVGDFSWAGFLLIPTFALPEIWPELTMTAQADSKALAAAKRMRVPGVILTTYPPTVPHESVARQRRVLVSGTGQN